MPSSETFTCKRSIIVDVQKFKTILFCNDERKYSKKDFIPSNKLVERIFSFWRTALEERYSTEECFLIPACSVGNVLSQRHIDFVSWTAILFSSQFFSTILNWEVGVRVTLSFRHNNFIYLS